MKFASAIIICCITLYFPVVVIRNLIFPTFQTVSANGSSPVGKCSNVTFFDEYRSSCTTPTTSVLFDGHIPTLTGLDRNMSLWARDLLILNSSYSNTTIGGIFTNEVFIDRIELVLFYCPEWGQSASILLFPPPGDDFTPTIHSCESLIRVCRHVNETRPYFSFVFHNPAQFNLIYLAEILIYADSSPCPPDSIISTPPLIYSTSTQGDLT